MINAEKAVNCMIVGLLGTFCSDIEFVQCRLGPGLDLQLYFEWNHVDCFGMFCFSGLDLFTIVHVAWLLMQHC